MPRRRGVQQRMLATVLFTDIVGSTETAAEIGDREWRKLIARHHAIVRRELKRHHGREMDTAGDGFFAAFDQPLNAILCATAVSEHLRPIGLRIRAGVHMGQVEIGPQKVEGIAVNIGARVAGQAEADQILVSSTVRDALAGSDVAFANAVVFDLKGVPGEWRLSAVEKDDRLLTEAVGSAARRDASPEAAAQAEFEGRPGTKRRLATVVVLAVLVGAAVAGGVLLLSRNGEDAFVPRPNTLVRLDATDGSLDGGVTVGTTPRSVAVGEGSVWVANFQDRTIQRVDPDTLEPGAAIGLTLDGNPTGVAVGGGHVWVTSGIAGTVFEVDPATNSATPIETGSGVMGVAYGEDAVWVTDAHNGQLIRIDPTSGSQVPIRLGKGVSPSGVAIGAGAVWVADDLGAQVLRVDPVSDRVVRIELRAGQPEQIAFGEGYVWVTNPTDDSVTWIDPATNRATTIDHVGNGPIGVATGQGRVWVTSGLDGTVEIIDPGSKTVVDRVEIGFSPEGVVVANGAVWVTVHSL